jgi:dUTP pyrophosphatase
MNKTHRSLQVLINRFSHSQGLDLPVYQTEGSAGLDLCAAVESELVIEPGTRIAIPTGIAIAVPSGFEAQVRSRSGLALKNGVHVLNSPGTIDSDYRGEIRVILINLGENKFSVRRGDRIAQLIVAPVFQITWDEVDHLPLSDRGSGGFGHTGL